MMIYLIDDDSEERQHSVNIFHQAGLNPICFSNTDSVLKAIAYQVPDYIFTDLRMPHFSGLDLVELIKKKKLCCQVFALTRYKLAGIEIIKNTFDGYLTKPLSLKQLNNLLRNPLKDE